jgi:hypothetical protein
LLGAGVGIGAGAALAPRPPAVFLVAGVLTEGLLKGFSSPGIGAFQPGSAGPFQHSCLRVARGL